MGLHGEAACLTLIPHLLVVAEAPVEQTLDVGPHVVRRRRLRDHRYAALDVPPQEDLYTEALVRRGWVTSWVVRQFVPQPSRLRGPSIGHTG